MATETDERTRERLRQLREAAGLTLADVGERAGMAASTVSRLESGARRLALDHLPPLARALGVTVDALLAPPEPHDPRVHGKPFVREGITFIALSRAPRATGLRAFKILYPERARAPRLRAHAGHDWFYVLSGTVELRLGDDQYMVGAGEAVEFDCRTPHWLGATGGGPAEALAIFGPNGERVHTH